MAPPRRQVLQRKRRSREKTRSLLPCHWKRDWEEKYVGVQAPPMYPRGSRVLHIGGLRYGPRKGIWRFLMAHRAGA